MTSPRLKNIRGKLPNLSA